MGARPAGTRHFIASVAPDNAASLALVRRLGFEQTGSVWDEDDGEELVFELRLPAASETAAHGAPRQATRRRPRDDHR